MTKRPSDRSACPAVRGTLRARRLWRRVRRGRRRPVARPGPAAGARRVWPRSATAARSGRTGSRATAPASRSRSIGRCSRCSPARRAAAADSRPGIVSLFLPRARGAERRARALVEATFLETGLPIAAWRSVPFDVAALGASAADSRPAFAHAIVERPSRGADDPRPLIGRRLRAPAGRRPSAAGDRRSRGRRRRSPRSPSRRPRRGRSSTRASSSAAACPISTPTCAPR